VITGFERLGLSIVAGIEMLDLAAVLLHQGEVGEATRRIVEAVQVFVAHRVRHEALGAITLLRDAFEMGIGSLAMIQEVTGFVRRLDIDPTLRFEARSWDPL
jgi:hypothetical protein